MHPVLFTVGSFHLYSFSLFIVLAWLIFSFVFWKMLRNQAVSDERIFDLTFYATILAFVGARATFVLLHRELFSDSILKIPAIWVQPGLSLYGALTCGILTMFYLARHYKVRVAYVLDSLAFALPISLSVGLLGAFLDGTSVGVLSDVPWGILYVGYVGKRHPVQIYEILLLFFVYLLVYTVHKRANKLGYPYGTTGLWFFLSFSLGLFLVEFLKDSTVYFSYLSINQWVLVAIFAESVGAFYIRGGGREKIRPILAKSRDTLKGSLRILYEKFSKRHTG